MSLLLLLRGSSEPEPEPTPSAAVVRERPPLWEAVQVTPPGSSRSHRWGGDEPDPANRVSGLSFSSSMPGGHEQMGCTLPRLPGIEYGDLERMSDFVVYGPGGEVRWQGRLTDAPSVSGDQMAVTPGAVGYKAHLSDSRRASMVFIDRDLSQWGGPGAQRRLDLNVANQPPQGDPSATWDTGSNAPALTMQIGGTWASPQSPVIEAWYDAGSGNAIASIHGAFSGPSDTAWTLIAAVLSDAAGGTFEATRDLYTAASSSFSFAPTARYRYGEMRWQYNATPGGVDGGEYVVNLTALRVIGDHGLTLRTGIDGFGGYFASDVLRYAIPRWAPQLAVTDESVQQSSFVISQLAFRDKTTPQAFVDEVTRFELLDWAVWGKTFWLHQRGTVGNTWITRVGPSRLRQTGPSDERLGNRVIVYYPDVDGTTRTVGPPGSGCDVEDAALQDDDPENPANKLGIERYLDPVQMQDVSLSGAAIEVGRRYLVEARALDRSGSCEITGYVFDDRGIMHPASAVRAGDRLIVADARDTSPRRIVRAAYNADTFTCSLDLDAPPQGLDALLARLQLQLVNV